MTGASLQARAGDALAIGLSGLCLLHCLALPAVAVALPVLGAWAEAEWVHWLFVALAAPISLLTLARPGGSLTALGMAVVGLTLLVAGAAELLGHEAETPLAVAGGLMLAVAHGINLARRRHAH